MSKLLLGSVAEKVLLHARGNVRVGKIRKLGNGLPRILIGFDGSRESKFAVEEVANRQWPKGTMVRLVSASEPLNRRLLVLKGIKSGETPQNGSTLPWPWIEEKLAKAREKVTQPGVEVETEILTGDPRSVLLAQARKFRADTLFLGNRGLTGVKRFLLGSVSTAVASHSPCSIEIIRKAPEW